MARSPLFDIYDPYGEITGRLGYDDDDLLTTRRRSFRVREPRIEDLMPEEEKTSLLRQLASAGTSGLSTAGYWLDMPGAFIRGLLAGKPLSVFGSADDRVTGRELLRQYGLAGRKDGWLNFATGLGAEVLLDPLSYIGLGLLGRGAQTAAGAAARNAGLFADDVVLQAARMSDAVPNIGTATFMRRATPETLADDLADQAARKAGIGVEDDLARTAAEEAARQESLQQSRLAFERVGGTDAQWTDALARMSRVSLPGYGRNAVDIFGSKAGDAFAYGSDYLLNQAAGTPYLGAVMRGAGALFNPRVRTFQDPEGQMFGRRLTDARQSFMRDAMRRIADTDVDLQRDLDAFRPGFGRSTEFANAVAAVLENQSHKVDPEVLALFENTPSARRLLDFAQDESAGMLTRARDLGIPLENLTPPNDVGYFFRQRVEPANATYAKGYAPSPPRALRDSAVASLSGGASRRDYTLPFPRWVLNNMYSDPDLARALRDAPDDQVQNLLQDWLRSNAADFKPIAEGRDAFQFMLERGGKALEGEELLAAELRRSQAYAELADSIRRAPEQYTTKGIPLYGNALNDLYSSISRSAEREATADVLLDELARNIDSRAADMVPGGRAVTIQDALDQLGFIAKAEGEDIPAGIEALARRSGIPASALMEGRSLPAEVVDRLAKKIVTARSPGEAEGLLKAFDRYTQSFKSLALLWPARYTRDAYSGAFAGMTQGSFNPLDALAGFQARRGNYEPLANRLGEGMFRKAAPGYSAEDLFGSVPYTPQQLREARIRKFLKESGGVGLSRETAVDDLGRLANNLTYRGTFPGATGPLLSGIGERMRTRPVPYDLLWAQRTGEGNPNWLIELGDRAAEGSDAFNRIGTYLTSVRQGRTPSAAKALTDLAQVNYDPSSALTNFERVWMRRLVPFYTYNKGIAPLVASELIQNPAGLTGQSIRAINRVSEPTEDKFVPEYLRQSAAVPLPAGGDLPDFLKVFGVSTPGITRFLTNIDLPHEGLINLFTPGIGNTATQRVISTLMRTGQNLLGQTNPLLKGPLEVATNRQFYSGRQLSDLYSMAEQYGVPGGRLWDQVASMVPGGSRITGAARQLLDSRISPTERAVKFLFNAGTGMKFQDVDQERTVRLAARASLNELLDAAKGMSTYENLSIKPEDLMRLSAQEQRQYLLYRTLQSEAARAKRQREKLLEDPLAAFM